jgi:hypothetical protein
MGGQILGRERENFSPCLSLRKIGFLGSGVKEKAVRFTSDCFLNIHIQKIKYIIWLMLLLHIIYADVLNITKHKYCI